MKIQLTNRRLTSNRPNTGPGQRALLGRHRRLAIGGLLTAHPSTTCADVTYVPHVDRNADKRSPRMTQ